MDTNSSLFNQSERDAYKELTPAQMHYVSGGRYAVVMIDGTRTGVVDMDRLEWDIFTGRIPVVQK